MLNVSVHTGLPRAVLQSRVPVPQGLCAGAGLCHLPGSALNLPAEILLVLQGKPVAGRIGPIRRGSFCCS